MHKEFEEILQTLEIEDLSTAELRKRVMALCSGKEYAKTIITEIEHIHIDITNHDNQPFYSIFLACAFYESGDKAKAIEYAQKSVIQFKRCGSSQGWNEALAHWVLGELYGDSADQNGSCQEYRYAARIFQSLALEYRLKGFYDESRHIHDSFLTRLDNLINSTHLPQQQPAISHSQMDSEGYLILPWIPIYQDVRAGRSGIIEFSPAPRDKYTEVQNIILDDKRYVLYYLRQLSPRDRQIRLTTGGPEWGLAKVRGDSMNALNLNSPINHTPIKDNDYVLFRKQPDGEDGDIVIASNLHARTGEFPYMVKRYRKSEGMLYSETTRQGEEYKPIKLNKDTQILAVVYAVAKPAD